VAPFLAYRAVSISVVGVWRLAAERCLHWLQDWVYLTQYLLLVSCWIVAVSSFLSYISLRWMSHEEHDPGNIVSGLRNNVVALAFFPIFIFVTTAIPFRLKLALPFPILALLLIIFVPNEYNEIFQAAVFKIIFILRSVIIPFECYLREQLLRKRFTAIQDVDKFRNRTGDILDTLMPPLVVEDIRENPLSAAPQHEFNNATIAQSDLCGFTELASTRMPQEVVEFIGELFGRFDRLTDMFDIYKVETVGDAYIAGQAEHPLTSVLKPLSVVRFAVAMVEATHEWSRERGETVSCRVGVHTGRCVGGIVGNDMQRYHLFGELMTQLEILESTAPRGGVQISQACRSALVADEGLSPDDSSSFSCKELMLSLREDQQLLTSKGEPHQWEAVGGRTILVTAQSSLVTSFGRALSISDIL